MQSESSAYNIQNRATWMIDYTMHQWIWLSLFVDHGIMSSPIRQRSVIIITGQEDLLQILL